MIVHTQNSFKLLKCLPGRLAVHLPSSSGCSERKRRRERTTKKAYKHRDTNRQRKKVGIRWVMLPIYG